MLILVTLFFVAFTIFKFDVVKFDLFHSFLGALSTDYINTQWFISWDLQHLLHGFGGYWSPPFYTPFPTTLGFGDHVLGQTALLIIPYLVTGSTIFCYNFLFLLTFVLTGVAAYCLFYGLTQNKISALTMSVAFDFCHFRYSIIEHMYVLTIYPMLFFLVFAHKFVLKKKPVHLVLAYVCLLWQILSGMNMGLFCFYIGFLFFAYFMWCDASLRNKQTIAGVLLGHSIVAVAFVWMAVPNVHRACVRKRLLGVGAMLCGIPQIGRILFQRLLRVCSPENGWTLYTETRDAAGLSDALCGDLVFFRDTRMDDAV